MVRIRVLGEPAFEGDDGPIELTGSWRAQSLFCWLALHPGTHPRSTVAPLFWPDVLDSSARASLRNALWAIRKALGSDADALVATRDRVGLDEARVWVDALSFADHVRDGKFADALGLVQGDPLTGLDDDWAYEYRDEHRDRLSDLLERLASEADLSDAGAATEWSRKRVALDPLDEAAQRALISRLIAAGDRAGALSAYGRFRQQLRTELGISPSAETRDLVLELQAAEQDAPPREAEAARAVGDSASGWAPGTGFEPPARLRGRIQSALVGRGDELSRLRELWADVERGNGARLVRLIGEAGIGKSRLARELALEASTGGAVVLFGAADGELPVPHQIWAEALGHLVSVLNTAEIQRRLGPGAIDLDPIAPRAAAGLTQADDQREADSGESRRYRLLEGVAALLDSVARDAPVLLVADDIHWADDSTAAIMRHVLESRPGMRLLIVATQRAEIELVEGLAQAISKLSREGLAVEFQVDGLPEAEVAELSQILSEHELSDELLGTIARETAGNPFFVGELVRYIDESDADPGVLSLTRADVPERVREVVDLRLRRLSEPAARLLSVAAVIGTEFELRLLEDVGSASDDELLSLLDEGLSARLISEADYGDDDTFVFSHILVRRTLVERLSRAARRRVHARIAEALERSRGDAALLAIAHHMCEAGGATDRERALEYAIRAAEQAVGNLAYAEAVDLFTRARSLLPEDDPRRRTLALKRAVAYQALFHAVYDAAAGDTRAEPA